MWVIVTLVEQNTHPSALLDIVDTATKILAVLIGGGWAYLNYVRGRTFKHRLEPNISGKTIRSKNVLFLSGLAQVKNVGLSKVTIQQKGTAIEVLSYILDDTHANAPKLSDQDVAVRSVFKAHGWIEPGEQIEETFLIPVPEEAKTVAFRLGLRIVSEHIEWNANSIVEIVPHDSLVFGKSYAQSGRVYRQNTEDDERTNKIERKKIEGTEQA